MKIDKPIDPDKLRRRAYPSAGDQLDAIIKTFAYLQAQGIDLGPDGHALVEQHQRVKNTHPKPHS